MPSRSSRGPVAEGPYAHLSYCGTDLRSILCTALATQSAAGLPPLLATKDMCHIHILRKSIDTDGALCARSRDSRMTYV